MKRKEKKKERIFRAFVFHIFTRLQIGFQLYYDNTNVRGGGVHLSTRGTGDDIILFNIISTKSDPDIR